jgi:membrane peptidoglycan carboxypeptidase
MLQKAKFKAKPKTVLSHNKPLEFNSSRITYEGTTVHIRQKGQTKLLRMIDPDAQDAAQRYVEQRARGAYIASICQPEAAFDLSIAAQTTEPSKEDIKALNARIQ